MTKRSLPLLVLAVFLTLVATQVLAAAPQGTRPDPTTVAWQQGLQATATVEGHTLHIEASPRPLPFLVFFLVLALPLILATLADALTREAQDQDKEEK